MRLSEILRMGIGFLFIFLVMLCEWKNRKKHCEGFTPTQALEAHNFAMLDSISLLLSCANRGQRICIWL